MLLRIPIGRDPGCCARRATRQVRGAARIPGHWLTFGSRASAFSGQPRSATNPANAVLNYLYAVMESEATIAARIVGLDPGIGVFHKDARFRQSVAADLMEPVRPDVDRYLLELLTRRTFGVRDFFETPKGVCCITPPLAAELASSARLWGQVVGRVAEDLVHRLVDAPRSEPLPRLITRPHGRPAAKVRAPAAAPATVAIDGRRSRTVVDRRFTGCGGPVPRGRRTCGIECEALVRKAAGLAGVAAMRERLHDPSRDGVRPDRSPEARAKASESMRRRRAEQKAWEAEHPEPFDPETYWRDVYPLVREMSVKRVATLTGLSKGEASDIRNGRRAPHRRWWEVLSSGERRASTNLPSVGRLQKGD